MYKNPSSLYASEYRSVTQENIREEENIQPIASFYNVRSHNRLSKCDTYNDESDYLSNERKPDAKEDEGMTGVNKGNENV